MRACLAGILFWGANVIALVHAGEIESVHIVAEPVYYQRSSDKVLVSAAVAKSGSDFEASGIVLSIIAPESEAGKIVSFHFDFPEQWNRWYKPGTRYGGTLHPRHIGTLGFICDPGWREVRTNCTAPPAKQ